jgi:hypothetical protein
METHCSYPVAGASLMDPSEVTWERKGLLTIHVAQLDRRENKGKARDQQTGMESTSGSHGSDGDGHFLSPLCRISV